MPIAAVFVAAKLGPYIGPAAQGKPLCRLQNAIGLLRVFVILTVAAAIAPVSSGIFRPVDIINGLFTYPSDECLHVGMGDDFFGCIEIACQRRFIKQPMDHAMTDAVQPFGIRAAL